MSKMIAIEVAYALPNQQWLLEVDVPEGTSMFHAAELSGIAQHFVDGLTLEDAAMGVFGKAERKPADRIIKAGERIEIYRPLIADPKAVRKQKAAAAKQSPKS